LPRGFKGDLGRPVNTESQRTEVLQAMRPVDFTLVIHGTHRQDPVKFYTNLHKFLRANILAVTEGDPHLEERRLEIEASGGQLQIVNNDPPSGATASILRKYLERTAFADLVFMKRQAVYHWEEQEDSSWWQLRLPI
jgi:bifunctional ADP-heptose synthase (sugar kinase/adenylyltransferase)